MAVIPAVFAVIFCFTFTNHDGGGVNALPAPQGEEISNKILTTDEVITADSETFDSGMTDSPVTLVTDSPTRLVTDAPTRLVTHSSAKLVTDFPMRLVADSSEKLEINSSTSVVTDSSAKIVTDSSTRLVTDSPAKLVTNSSATLVTDSPSKPVTEAPPAWLQVERPSHPCRRPCVEGQAPMTCHYEFAVEWYYAMSKACHNCSKNITDCYRPECIAANGMKRTIITVNRMLPGPSIEVCLGDYIIVDVMNHLMDEATSIHWHGHHQRGSPYMDGVPFISQCPISPNSVFRYQYSADNAGTHFWHSHTGVQRGDGVFGSLVIRTPESKNPHASLYDEDLYEHTMVVLDWSHELGVVMLTAHYQSDGDNKPESMIINGRGRYYNDTQQMTNTPLEVFTVKKGMRYRFRLINAGVQNCPIDLTIDNHTMTVISSDGSDVKPQKVDSLVSYAGERWDFVLTADADMDNYWMRFTGLMDCDERFTKSHQVAVLHYQGAPEQEPLLPVGYKVHPKRDLQLNSLNVALAEGGTLSMPHLESVDTKPDISLKETPDQQIYISFDFYPKDNPHYHKKNMYGFSEVKEKVYTPQFNDISMKLPHFPLMSQFQNIDQNTFCDHQALKNCNTTFCQCTNVINIPLGNVVELILIDKGITYNANHPFHLHGHPFRVVAMDRLGQSVSVDTVKALDEEHGISRNLTNPPIKDTVTVPDGGYTILRLHASNPGYWIFHCHIEFHVEVGMALIFKVGEHSDFSPVPHNFPKCGDYFNSAAVVNNKTEVDLQSGITYNVTVDSVRDEDNFISFSHLLNMGNETAIAASDAVRYNVLSYLIPSIIVISLLLH